ncbi:MAG TPA: YciI family protein [Candidatus Udaeobacter sp.]|nr:YciI family protein [Candidatus Udaeobacter sp.]
MLYAVLCYHHEAEVMAWPKEKDDAVLAKRAVVKNKYAAAGKMGPVARLMPTTAATTLRHGKETLVIDGPFAETKEQLLGFYVVEGANLEEAIAFARELGEGETVTFEIRPIRYFEPGTKRA